VAFILAAAIDWIWDLTVVGAVGVACLALLVGAASVARVESAGGSQEERTPRRPRQLGLRAVVAAVALMLVAAEAVPLATQQKVRASQEALKEGNADSALAEAQDARALQGWAASPHLQVALVQESRGRLRSARESIRIAIDRDRSDWRLWAVAARIEEASGSIAEARRSFDRARALNPRSPLFKRSREEARPTGPSGG
jgi:Flp pilus assembly protein TadD